MLLSRPACTEVALGVYSAISGFGQGIAVKDAVSICSQTPCSMLKSKCVPCQPLSQLSAVLVSACRRCLCALLGHGLAAHTNAAADGRPGQDSSPC